ncbi:MAG: hypothetical protein JWO36_376 [Myxococcales bacterium]|nr:hypothetical protein [Myxococcales bacterium]
MDWILQSAALTGGSIPVVTTSQTQPDSTKLEELQAQLAELDKATNQLRASMDIVAARLLSLHLRTARAPETTAHCLAVRV